MVRADFQQGMESVSKFKMSTVTENYWRIMTLPCGVLFPVTELI